MIQFFDWLFSIFSYNSRDRKTKKIAEQVKAYPYRIVTLSSGKYQIQRSELRHGPEGDVWLEWTRVPTIPKELSSEEAGIKIKYYRDNIND
jgi:hypothetical protein